MADEMVKFDEANALPAELKDELEGKAQENMEGVQPRLPKMIMPTGRGKEFQIEQQAEADVETKEVVGVLLYQTASNAYWSEPFGGGDAVVPDCASHDGIKPSSQYENLQSETCAKCPHNRFGSARDPEGNKLPGKACRNVKRVVILRTDDSTMPCILTVPPSSIKSFDDYMVMLAKNKRPYYTVGTGIKAETEKNKSGIEYPHLLFELKGYINNQDVINDLLKKRDEWVELLKTMVFQQDDVDPNPSNGTSFSPEATNVTGNPEF